jgi:3-hydroxymyristoyl/3-hydroxydecanoyl-(acyl carrier protein) dehydratase
MIKSDIEKSFVEYKEGVFIFGINKNFIAFKGHFPHYAILPGIVEIEMVMFCIRKILSDKKPILKELKKIKFIKPIEPNTKVQISLNQNGDKFNAIIKNDVEVFAQVSLIIDEAAL